MDNLVILVHGLWLRSWTMASLGKRLQAQGFRTLAFDYASFSGAFSEHERRFADWVSKQSSSRLHFVGHSLGGVLCARVLHSIGDKLPPGRLVCLGSPLRGSALAMRMRMLGLGPWALGEAAQAVSSDLGSWRGVQELGIVAGRTPLGASLLFGGLPGEHDGTVQVSETRLPGARAHQVIDCAHTALPYSEQAAQLTARFLQNGSFQA